jgi:hypothetical protein
MVLYELGPRWCNPSEQSRKITQATLYKSVSEGWGETKIKPSIVAWGKQKWDKKDDKRKGKETSS